MTKTVGPSTGGVHDAPVTCMVGPTIVSACASMLSGGVVLDRPGTPLTPTVCGNMFSSVFALLVHRPKAARMLLRSAASEVTAAPFRDAGDTPLACDVVGEEAKKFLSNWEDKMLMSPLEVRRSVYFRSLRRLRAVGLLHWTCMPRGIGTLFRASSV